MSLPAGNSSYTDPATLAAADEKTSGFSLSNPRIQTLAQSAPQRATIALLLTGMVIGLVVAYVVIPTEFTGASPRHLSQQATQQWVRMVAVGHSQAISYDDVNALLVLQQIPEPQATVRSLAANVQIPLAERQALEAITRISGFNELTGAEAPEDPGLVSSSLQVVASLIIVMLGAVIVSVVGRGLLGMGGTAEAAPKAPESTAAAAPQSSLSAHSGYTDTQSTRQSPSASLSASSTMHPQLGAPVLHTMSTFIKGSNYDDSFAIELNHAQGNDFLGECGISASSQVAGELQSVEFWGFDIQTQETVSKFFAAPAALGDAAMLAHLGQRVSDPADDIVAAEAGAVQVVESKALIIQAEIKAVVCNYGGGLPNSGIESLQIELMAWYKGVGRQAAVPAEPFTGAAASPFSDYADMSAAPPAQNAAPPPPPAGSVAPQKPKQRPEDEENDPFGGTGNFMPYS
ncbi:MAG: hypothetical protein F4Z94_00285 [Chloroflexi bacterium]|nr:hypothetical protein [Chloroflexota bacterium]